MTSSIPDNLQNKPVRAGASVANAGETSNVNSNAAVNANAGAEMSSPPPSPPPPRGPRNAALAGAITIALFAVALGVVLAGPIRQGARWSAGVVKAAFNNDQSSASDGQAAMHAHGANGEIYGDGDHDDALNTFYTCGMHPWVILPEPGLCPICHMDLTPIDPGKLTGEIAIDPVVTQNMGVRVQAVIEGPLTRTIRTVGLLEHDETTVRDVTPRYSGWIEKLYVDSTGEHVNAGDRLFDVYSPELYAAQQDILLARGRPELVGDARERLMNFGLAEAQIERLLAGGEAQLTVTIHSPYTGHVIEKSAREGMRIEPATLLYRIADHRRIWMNVQVYERQFPFTHEGMLARMTLPHLPGRVFEGRVVFEYPHIDPESRQLTLRVEFDNPDLILKPGMYAAVELESALNERAVLAPLESILDTGERRLAFVSLGGGRFEPRRVVTGVESGEGMIEVIDGLAQGELVVTSGQFLLDSEARIRAGLAKMMSGEPAITSQNTPDDQHQHDGPLLRAPKPDESLEPYGLDVCVVTGLKLGAMGDAPVYAYKGRELKFCCAACETEFNADPTAYLQKLDAMRGKDNSAADEGKGGAP